MIFNEFAKFFEKIQLKKKIEKGILEQAAKNLT